MTMWKDIGEQLAPRRTREIRVFGVILASLHGWTSPIREYAIARLDKFVAICIAGRLDSYIVDVQSSVLQSLDPINVWNKIGNNDSVKLEIHKIKGDIMPLGAPNFVWDTLARTRISTTRSIESNDVYFMY